MRIRHILDKNDIPDNEIFHCGILDMSVWEIRSEPNSNKLYVKPGELERVLKDYFDDESSAIVRYRQLTVENYPIKEFDGF